MKEFGKTIKIFLIDGNPSGRMTCELSNWTGKAYKIPRIKIKNCSDRDDLKKTGVYLLFGKSDELNDLVYIGEAENIFNRLTQHVSSKDFWSEAIVFISKDENLNKAHAKYLESRLFEISKEVGRYEVENSITPTQSSISESDISEMEEFILNIRILTNSLGHKLFEKTIKAEDVSSKEIFNIQSARGANAKGESIADGFLVLKDSCAAMELVDSMPKGFAKQREKLMESGILNEISGKLLFTKDYIFSSSSTAASVVMGRNANGLIEWKNKSGETLKDYQTKAQN